MQTAYFPYHNPQSAIQFNWPETERIDFVFYGINEPEKTLPNYLLNRCTAIWKFKSFKITLMEKQNERLLTVMLSHNPTSGNFFIDFYNDGKLCLGSIVINEQQAIWYSRELGIKILE